jgi:hypothetical protein
VLYVGLDDTDTLDHPGTNKLARHLAGLLGRRFAVRLIVRHQLLEDPRVPCTRKNGCAAMLVAADGAEAVPEVEGIIKPAILAWVPAGSDPGLCIAAAVPDEVRRWGRRCQRELVTQSEARALAKSRGIYLEGLGGSEDGVIGALAAAGLVATGDDGRVIHRGDDAEDLFEIDGPQPITALTTRGVDEVRCIRSGDAVTTGVVDLGKRLRPNYRGGRVVLFVAPRAEPGSDAQWDAVRVT